MSHKTIDHKILLKRDGQTQPHRMPQWLTPERVPVDSRTTEDLWIYVQKIAGEMNFFDTSTNEANGTWNEFFDLPLAEIKKLEASHAVPPHLALLYSFLKLYKEPQQLLNNFTKRHLDFYYNEVLRMKKNPPVADKTHVVFELKKNAGNTLLKTDTKLLAGKDDTKKELNYSLTHDIIVNASKVAGLRSVFVDPANKNFIHYAPVANSKDGIGEPPDPLNLKWIAFGHKGLPLASVGFCLASDVLLIKEGSRKVSVTLELQNVPVEAETNSHVSGLFKISITGEKGWIGPKTVTPVFDVKNNNTATASFNFSLTNEEPPVVNYDPALHGFDYAANSPLLQILINNEKGNFGYEQLKDVIITAVTVDVDVSGMKNLQLENDAGTLNAKKPFFPFGNAPETGANFYVGCDEAFTKRLKIFSVIIDWKNIPDDKLNDYYIGYPGNNNNNTFTATASFKDGASWNGFESKQIFDSANALNTVTLSFNNPSFGIKIPPFAFPFPEFKPVRIAGVTFGQSLNKSIKLLQPAVFPAFQLSKNFQFDLALKILSYFSAARKGFLSLRLNRSFLFREYRELNTKNILLFSKGPRNDENGNPVQPVLLKEPFAPEVQSLTFSYTATTGKISLTDSSIHDYVNSEVRFYHATVFGQLREHAYQRTHAGFLQSTSLRLLPQYADEGEFNIGLTGLKAEDSVCILFQVAEGSANPDKPAVDVTWHVLCNNYWKKLGPEDFIFDTTNQLLTSGVIKLVIPKEATTENTLLPPGFLWLKASIAKDSDAVCLLTDVQSNAAITEFKNNDNDPMHLSRPLQAGKINKLKEPVGSIKTVSQPYASFGGQMQEDDNAYYIRVSERLRHKERSISIWDNERLILQHFPAIHKVKCIPHASGTSFYEPGHTLTVVVPDLSNQNAVNILQPKADKNTLDKIYDFLHAHSTAWAVHHVINPKYEPVKISVRIKLKTGYEFNYYEKKIDEELQQFLSPWISDKEKDIQFGGKVTKSMIVQFLENLEYVDFLTDLKLFQSLNGGISFGSDTDVAEVSNPAAILVSHYRHEIFNF